MNTVHILKTARDLISKPGAWMQGDYFKTVSGDDHTVEFDHSCMCAAGAVALASGVATVSYDDMHHGKPVDELMKSHAIQALKAAVIATDEDVLWPNGSISTIATFNDKEGRTQSEVVALFDAAILKLESKANEN